MDMCILPVFTYGASCWTFDDHSAHRMEVEQKAMERIILSVNRTHRIRNEACWYLGNLIFPEYH